MRFHGFRGSEVKGPVAPNANGVLPLEKPLLDSSRLLSSIHRFIDAIIDFIDASGWLAAIIDASGWLAGWLADG